ncbi:phosphoglycerate mutase [Paenibacillus albidus]|uniref:Phosphoglycerate mutase n=1 Tax=Paenibacillus albidus TaxID=2041023 RepID=A0A917FRU3_9BACL|nr:histidine phosphatase family protein [Paenibacillus albidus]GGG00231.1 phosphoglycerate mutase [Paenibacillus albidus]
MKTYIYMVRHGDSPKAAGTERTRGLSVQGEADARTVAALLRKEGLNAFYSSPYTRAVETIAGLAQELEQEIHSVEDLREILFSPEYHNWTDQELHTILRQMFADPDFTSPGGESSRECQERAIRVIHEILKTHKGQCIAIGTHGMVMCLMMNYFDPSYGLDFLWNTSKPDIYRMEFQGMELKGVERLWGTE